MPKSSILLHFFTPKSFGKIDTKGKERQRALERLGAGRYWQHGRGSRAAGPCAYEVGGAICPEGRERQHARRRGLRGAF